MSKNKLLNSIYTLILAAALLSMIVIIADDQEGEAVTAMTESVNSRKVITDVKDTDNSGYALTFECQTAADDIDDIIALLNNENIKASFFVTGIWADKHRDEVRLIAKNGHDICFHGYTHLNMTGMQTGRIGEEFYDYKTLMSEILGTNEWTGKNIFRPPYCDYDQYLIKQAGREGCAVVTDSVSALDWKSDISASVVADNVMGMLKPGDILSFHIGYKNCFESVKRVISDSRSKGMNPGRLTDFKNF